MLILDTLSKKGITWKRLEKGKRLPRYKVGKVEKQRIQRAGFTGTSMAITSCILVSHTNRSTQKIASFSITIIIGNSRESLGYRLTEIHLPPTHCRSLRMGDLFRKSVKIILPFPIPFPSCSKACCAFCNGKVVPIIGRSAPLVSMSMTP